MGSERMLPRYPIYIPSRARPETAFTAQVLDRDGVEFRICVAPYEVGQYEREFGERVLELPSNRMDIVAVRNWIRDHAEETGAERHWQLDDNIRHFQRRWRARRMYCRAGLALRAMEDFTDRYSNVGLSGPNYSMFCKDYAKFPPFVSNCKVYSCTLVNHEIAYRWRGPYNDDTDLCLQVLAGGWCTVAFNAFLQVKTPTLTMKGGMTDSNENNYRGDGRLKMARTLERRWLGVVDTRRRFSRPQHHVEGDWKRFDTPLKLKEGIDLDKLAEQPSEYGMELRDSGDLKSERMKALRDEYNSRDA